MLWIILATAIILIIGAWWFLFGGMQMNEQRKMEAYLKGKYGEEFVVENYQIEGSGIGVEGDPTAIAYPKNNPQLKFEIIDSGNIRQNTHNYWDSYVAKLWEKEETDQLKSSLIEILGYLPEYTVEIHVIDASAAEKSINKDNMLSFSEGVSRYKQDINYTLRVNSNEKKSGLNKDSFVSDYVNLMKVINSKGKDPILNYSLADGSKRYGISMSVKDYNNTPRGQLQNSFKEWTKK